MTPNLGKSSSVTEIATLTRIMKMPLKPWVRISALRSTASTAFPTADSANFLEAESELGVQVFDILGERNVRRTRTPKTADYRVIGRADGLHGARKVRPVLAPRIFRKAGSDKRAGGDNDRRNSERGPPLHGCRWGRRPQHQKADL